MYPQSAEFNVKFRPGFSEFHQQVKAKMYIHVCMHRINYCRAVFFILFFISIHIKIYLFIYNGFFVCFVFVGRKLPWLPLMQPDSINMLSPPNYVPAFSNIFFVQ